MKKLLIILLWFIGAVVTAGVYNENVVIYQCGGTALAPTVIMAYPGETPIIHVNDNMDGGGADVGVTDDYFGATRGGVPDIGAIEYIGSPLPDPPPPDPPPAGAVFLKTPSGKFQKSSSGKLLYYD